MADQTFAALPDTYTSHTLPVNAQIPSQVLSAVLYLALLARIMGLANMQPAAITLHKNSDKVI